MAALRKPSPFAASPTVSAARRFSRVHAPNVVDVETVRHGKVRRAKLYYLRDRLGKAAKVKEKV